MVTPPPPLSALYYRTAQPNKIPHWRFRVRKHDIKVVLETRKNPRRQEIAIDVSEFDSIVFCSKKLK